MILELLDKKDDKTKTILTKKTTNKLLKIIKENKIPLIIDENDFDFELSSEMPNRGKKITSLEDLIAVHVSQVVSTNDTIMTQEDSGITHEIHFVDPSTGITHKVPYITGNDTIHFTLNCVVENHEAGNDWNSYKYGIMTPLIDLDKDKILDVKGEDTYHDGSVTLKSGYLLFCPFGERNKIEKDNPNATIIEYKDITLNEAMSYMILLTGYKIEPYGTYGWGENSEYSRQIPDTLELEKIATQNGYPSLKGNFGNALHSETKYMARRMWKREYEAIINLIDYTKENGIDMPEEVIQQLILFGGAYNLPGTVPVTMEEYKNVVFPIIKKYGYYIDESIFNGIEEDSTQKIIIPGRTSYMETQLYCPNWENILRTNIIKIIKHTNKTLTQTSKTHTKK